jgi:hypothetical protein
MPKITTELAVTACSSRCLSGSLEVPPQGRPLSIRRAQLEADMSGLPNSGAQMLDAFIIDKIRRERESRERDQRQPLRIPSPQDNPWGEPHPKHPPVAREEEGDETERGVVIVDFTI